MRFTDFILALDKAGWEGVRDAQHAKIHTLWKTMYPLVAELEDEVMSLTDEIQDRIEDAAGEDI